MLTSPGRCFTQRPQGFASPRPLVHPDGVFTATTQGIRVSVTSTYLPNRSSPGTGEYVFAYTVQIANEGRAAAQLRSRHWVITDGGGAVHEVRGDGVVGAQPLLQPGQKFEYTSGCVIKTPRGTMHGTYQMVRDSGEQFDAVIPPFALSLPHALN